MRLYSINEVFGPVDCEIPEVGKDKCGKKAWTFILSKYENSILVIHSGPEATQQIFQQSLGTAICDHHLDLLFERKKKSKTIEPMIKVKEIRYNKIPSAEKMIEDAKIVKVKSGEVLLYMRCGCGREVKFTEDGITTYLPDVKATHKGKSQMAKNHELDVMLVTASFAIRCTCGKDMSGTFVKQVAPERKYYVGSNPKRFIENTAGGRKGITGI